MELHQALMYSHQRRLPGRIEAVISLTTEHLHVYPTPGAFRLPVSLGGDHYRWCRLSKTLLCLKDDESEYVLR